MMKQQKSKPKQLLNVLENAHSSEELKAVVVVIPILFFTY